MGGWLFPVLFTLYALGLKHQREQEEVYMSVLRQMSREELRLHLEWLKITDPVAYRAVRNWAASQGLRCY